MAPKRRRPPGSGRFTFILLLCSALLLVIVVRLVWVQVVDAPAYSAKATAQRMRDIELPARRGTIYDREGEPLAVSVDARTVYAAPNTIKDKAGAAQALASVLGGSPKSYQSKLAKDTGFVYIARQSTSTRPSRSRRSTSRASAFSTTRAGSTRPESSPARCSASSATRVAGLRE